MKTRTAADRLKPYASIVKLAHLPFDERRAIATDLKEVLRERSAFRLMFWVMLAAAWLAIAASTIIVIMARRYGG